MYARSFPASSGYRIDVYHVLDRVYYTALTDDICEEGKKENVTKERRSAYVQELWYYILDRKVRTKLGSSGSIAN